MPMQFFPAPGGAGVALPLSVANGGTGTTDSTLQKSGVAVLDWFNGTLKYSGSAVLNWFGKTLSGMWTGFVLSPAAAVSIQNISGVDYAVCNTALADTFHVTPDKNFTLYLPVNTATIDGQKAFVRVRQPASGGPFTMALHSGTRLCADIPDATLSTGANKTDYLLARWNKPDDMWDVISFMKGP